MGSSHQDCICRSVYKNIRDEEIKARYIQILVKYIMQQEESKKV